MPAGLVLSVAADSLLGRDLLVPLGGIAGALTLLGLLLLIPLHRNQRREIARLERWRDRDPDAGTREFRAISAPGAPAAEAGRAGPKTAAERVTSERPALSRVGTAEGSAVEPDRPSLVRRAVERGPRHPLVISLLAVLLAAVIIVTAGLLLRAADKEGDDGRAAKRAAISVVVLNASSSTGLAGDVADHIDAVGFTVAGTTVAAESASQSVVKYGKGAKREAKLVARSLGVPILQPFDRVAEAAADGADVVVIAGDDAPRAIRKGSGGAGKD